MQALKVACGRTWYPSGRLKRLWSQMTKRARNFLPFRAKITLIRLGWKNGRNGAHTRNNNFLTSVEYLLWSYFKAMAMKDLQRFFAFVFLLNEGLLQAICNDLCNVKSEFYTPPYSNLLFKFFGWENTRNNNWIVQREIFFISLNHVQTLFRLNEYNLRI